MDVTCEHCEAEYEFDETLLSDKGTTVKCSACSHVFRVMPPPREGGRAPLKLRRVHDGNEREIGSLRELQQRIREGEVSIDDQIGRDGFPFRRLGDVPELKNFFSNVPASEPAPSGPSGSPAAPPSASASATPSQTLLGNSPTARPPAPYHDPAFPAPRAAQPSAKPAWTAAAPKAAAKPDDGEPDDSAAKRTMMGVGPLDPPRPPLPGAGREADRTPTPAAKHVEVEARGAAREQKPEARALAAASTPTLLGAPNARPGAQPAHALPEVKPPERTPAGGLPQVGHAPTLAALQADARALPGPEHRPQAPSLPRFELPGAPPEKVGPPVGRSWSPSSPPSQPAPASWAARAAGASVLATPGPGAAPVRLYLHDDEPPPARAMRRTSRLWLVALLALLGIGGWIGVHAMSTFGGDADAPVGRVVTPPPPSAPTSPTPATASATDAPAPAQPTSEPAPPAAKPAADKPPEKEAAKATPRDKPAPKEAAPEAASGDKAKPERTEDYGQLVAKAAQLSSKGDQGGAIKAYQAALALRPTGSEANSGLGFALLKANKATEALPLFDRAADSGFAEANIGLGDAYRKLGQPSSAVEAYRTYLERLPDGPRAAYARSWIDKLDKGGDAPRDEPAREDPRARRDEPKASDDYRPAGELVPPSEPVPAAEQPPDDAPAAPPGEETQ